MRPEAANAQNSRQPLLWISLLLTLALVYWQWSAEQEAADEAIVADSRLTNSATHSSLAKNNLPSAVTPAAAPTSVTLPESQLNSAESAVVQPAAIATVIPVVLPRKLPAKVSHVLFAAHEWLPPPAKPQPPPPPQAPQLPYTYVGSMEDMPDGHTVILMQQKKVLIAKVGGQVSAQWRLDKEDPQSVYFTYLPLDKPVSLSKAKTAGNQRQSMAEAQPEDNIPLEQ